MKAYGIKSQDRGCCPGHDKFSDHCYNSRRSIKAKRRDTKYAHSRERTRIRIELAQRKIQEEIDYLNQLDSDWYFSDNN